MKKFTIILLLLLPTVVFSQSWKRTRKEMVYGAGVTNFLGDLGGANQVGTNFVKDLELSLTRPAFQVSYRYKLQPFICAKYSIHYARLRGDDNLTQEIYRNNRNLKFRTNLWEASAQIEGYITREKTGHRYKIKNVRGKKTMGLNIYGFVGVGGIFFNPKGQYAGRWYALQPLGTEGQGIIPGTKKYSRISVVIPYGIGGKKNLNKREAIGFEMGIRKTFSDYIDDVSKDYYDNNAIKNERGELAARLADPSDGVNPTWTQGGQQRGDPKDKDSYMFVMFYYTKKLTKRRTKAKF